MLVRWSSLATCLQVVHVVSLWGGAEHWGNNPWDDFVQNSILRLEKCSVSGAVHHENERAKEDDDAYQMRQAPDKFVESNIAPRLKRLSQVKKVKEGREEEGQVEGNIKDKEGISMVVQQRTE